MTARILTKKEAAAYCGLTISGFNGWLEKKLIPGPLPGTRRWDKAALDAALDHLSSLKTMPQTKTNSDPFEKWRSKTNVGNP